MKASWCGNEGQEGLTEGKRVGREMEEVSTRFLDFSSGGVQEDAGGRGEGAQEPADGDARLGRSGLGSGHRRNRSNEKSRNLVRLD